MTKRQRSAFPHPDLLIKELRDLSKLLERKDEIVRGYRMALDLGFDPRTGTEGGVDVGGSFKIRKGDGSVTGYVPETAITNVRALAYQQTAKRTYDRVEQARMAIGNVLAELNRGRMGESFSQPTHTDRSAIITQDELDDAVAKKRRDEEMTG